MEHARTRTLVIVIDVVEPQAYATLEQVGKFIGGPGVRFRKAYLDDQPPDGPGDALKAPGSDGPPPEDQSTAGYS